MFGTQSGKSLGTVVVCFLATKLATAQTSSSANDWKPVEDAMGRTGQVSGDVIRFGMPRKDLHVTLDGVQIKPALGSVPGQHSRKTEMKPWDGRSGLDRKRDPTRHGQASGRRYSGIRCTATC